MGKSSKYNVKKTVTTIAVSALALVGTTLASSSLALADTQQDTTQWNQQGNGQSWWWWWKVLHDHCKIYWQAGHMYLKCPNNKPMVINNTGNNTNPFNINGAGANPFIIHGGGGGNISPNVIQGGGSGGKGSNVGVIAAINALGNKLEALSIARVKAANNAAHQVNGNVPIIELMNVNHEKNNVNDAVTKEVTEQTAENIKNSLQQIPDSALTYNIKTGDVEKVTRQIKDRNKLRSHLANIPASDTLYSDIMGIESTEDGKQVAKPSHLYNNYFNFGSLFAPKAYTPSQQTAANYYLDYLTNRYNSLTSGINFDKLKSNLNKYKNQPEKLASKLNDFKNSDAYRDYEMTIRSLMANKSIALNNMNKLMLERTPIETEKPNPTLAQLSLAVGVKPTKEKITDPNNPGKKITVYAYASPLQISSYIANYRVQSKSWYHNMATASPATVQRQTLYVLAEIESQLHQAHLDRERMLATMTALGLQSSASNQLALRTKAQAVNSAIDDINDDDSSDQFQSTSGSNQAPKFNATGADKQEVDNGHHHKKEK